MRKIIISALLTTASFSTMAATIGEVVKTGNGNEYASVTEVQLKYFNPKTMCMYGSKFYSEGSIIKTPDGGVKKCEFYFNISTSKTETNLSWRSY